MQNWREWRNEDLSIGRGSLDREPRLHHLAAFVYPALADLMAIVWGLIYTATTHAGVRAFLANTKAYDGILLSTSVRMER